MKIPKKITSSPILEAIVEIRFNTQEDIERDTVFPRIFSKLEKYLDAQIKKLPIREIPNIIRDQDPSLKYKPYYEIEKGNFTLHIGPNVVTLITSPEKTNGYIGWENIFKELGEIYSILEGFSFITEYKRIGVRYINFFEEKDIFEKINLSIDFPQFLLKNKNIAVDIQSEKLISRVQISNNSEIRKKDSKLIQGSVIDIDTSCENNLDDLLNLVNGAHNTTKEVFFSLLQENFLKTLDPKY